MSLYRKRGSDIWYVGLTRNGKRVQFSTRTSDKAEAGLIEAAFKLRLDGGRREQFIKLMDAVMGDAATGSAEPTQQSMLANLSDIAFEDAAGICARSREARVRVVDNFVEWLKEHQPNAILVTDVTPTIAWDYAKSLREGRTAKTVQKVIAHLSATWGGLIRRGLVTENVWRYAHVKSDPTEERTGRAFTTEEVSAILKAAHGTWLEAAVMVAAYTGLRQGDVISLEWEDVDLEAGTITVTPSKTARLSRTVTIPIHPSLDTFLRSLPERDGLVVRGVPTKAATRSNHWKACLDKAGIKADGEELMTFHNLRHTFATWVRMAGADKGEQMLLGGWSQTATANKYDHASVRLRDVVGAMPSL